MTVTGFIFSGVFSCVPHAAASQALLRDFAKKTLFDNDVKSVEIIDSGSVLKRMSELNNNGDGAFLCIAEDTAIAEGQELSSDFCVHENIRYVTENGEFAGAFILSPMEFDEISELKNTRVLNARKITPDSFSCILRERKTAVYNALCKNNVYTESADGVMISPLADIGSGSFIGNGVRIAGETVIGKNCTVTGTSRIEDSNIADNTAVTSGIILNSKIGRDCTVGPFAYVRPGSQIGNCARVGDFVEIKNSVIGDGTKISHLTYVGDSDVGGGVKFGCGTVTVNYDGIKKHRTVIGDNVFIGCNTNLVAPVTVGDNAFIAAGSTITEEIPPESFAIARQRQTTKENYVAQKMPDMIKK